jgi:hypothetical protein
MFIYKDNLQLKDEIKKAIIDCHTTNKAVADTLGITPQTYQHLINKKQLGFVDVKRIADAAGFEIHVDFVPIKKD